jgi:hypothetical protein
MSAHESSSTVQKCKYQNENSPIGFNRISLTPIEGKSDEFVIGAGRRILISSGMEHQLKQPL